MAIINGTAGADTLNGTGGGVIDTISGGAGNDLIQSVNAPLTDTAAWAADAAADGAGDVLDGGAGDDIIIGSAGALIFGGDGNDELDGLVGSHLSGGAGNDTIGGDVAVYTGASSDYAVTPTLLHIGNGQWTPVYEVRDLRPGSPDGTDIVYANIIQFADGIYVPPAQPDSDALFLEASHNEVFTPEIAADVAVPGTPSPVLDANTLLAFGVTAASFSIVGGADAAAFTLDPLTGQLSFATPPDFEAPGDVASGARVSGLQLAAAGDNVYEVVLKVVDVNGVEDLVGVLVRVEDVFGEFDALLDGEVVTGTLENDFINDGGKLGVTLLGLDGDDTFTIVNPATVDGGVGLDAVDLIRDLPASLTLTQAGATVNVSDGSVLTNVEAINYTGSTGADAVLASAVSTVALSLNGNEGNDTLTGGAAADELIGGAGSDLLSGGAGNDTLYASLVPAAGNPNVPVPGEVDTLVGGAGNDVLVGDGGSTVVVYAGNLASYTLALDAVTGVLTVTDSTGIEGVDTVSGFAVLRFADVSLDANLNPIVVPNRAPLIQSDGGGANAALTVNENTTAVTTVQATDPDGNPVTYSIAGGADAALFQINATTGALSFKAAPNAEAPTDAGANGVYDVVVQASDGTLTDTQAIAVTVANVNEAPVFTFGGGLDVVSASVAENFAGSAVISATDPDLLQTLTYSISGGADAALFQINAATGALSFKAAPNAEAPADAGADGVYEVVLQVSDGALTDNQTLLIRVTDVNEFAVTAPVDADAGANRVANGAAAGTAVGLTARATDADATTNTVSYAIAGFTAASPFRIDAATGVVSVNNPAAITTTVATTQTLTVVATSADGSSASQAFTIAIDPPVVGNRAPVIQSDGGGANAAVTVNENTTAVTTVQATDPDGNPITYSISGGADAALFQINATTGALSFKAAPNAEAPTDAGANRVYDLVVQASDGTLTDTQAIAVTVADVNEFAVTAPVDADAGANRVANGAAAGTAVGLTARATDADATTNTVSYAIAGFTAASAFKIDAATGVVTVNNPAAITSAAATTQTITVVATSADGSTASQAFAIAIDAPVVGNRAPVIQSDGGGANAAVTVNENTTAVTTVQATDPDGNPITYSITGGADAALFQINAITGALSFKAAPNAEAPTDAGANRVYDLVVQASDGTLTDTQAIAVTVADVNEFAVTKPTDGNTSPVQWYGGVTTVPDPKGGTAADLQGGSSGQYGAITGLGSQGGAMTLSASVRFDSTGAWQRVLDFGQANSGGIGNIYVGRLGTSNDLTFTIEKTGSYVYRATAAGAITNGQWLNFSATVDATGLMKLYINGTLAASCQGVAPQTGVRDFFYIGKSGFAGDALLDGAVDNVLLLKGSITAAQAQSIATNGAAGTPGLPTGLAIDIGASVETGSHHVASGAAAGTPVNLTVKAVDADATNNTVTYSITSAGSPFTIDPVTGVVKVASGAVLNYATASSHTITVQAASSDGSKATQTFTIYVDKPGNQAPVIQSDGGGATAAVTINENTAAVTTVKATDPDGNRIAYSISGGADAALFQINATTGELSFKTAPNAEAPTDAGANRVYDVVVQASDGTLTDTQAIAVTVADVNEFAIGTPIDIDGAANTVLENLPAGSRVGIQAKAVDADAGNNTVSYALSVNPGNLFAIDPVTGIVTTKAALDFETCAAYAIQVKASSSDGSVSYANFAIAVGNANDAPVITSPGTVSVAENTQAVTTVKATDQDAGQKLSYSIVGGADAAAFVIDPATGVLKFANPLGPDFEKPADAGANNIYDVQVKVSDSAGASALQALAIQVTNVASLNLVGTNVIYNNLQGGADDDVLSAKGLTDYLYGNGGNDTLIGNGGVYDLLDGGAGSDTASYANAPGSVTANLALGYGQAGDAAGDWYVSIENLLGSGFNDTLIGSALANALDGGAGNDTLVGNAGADLLTGGSGRDVFKFAAVGDSTPASPDTILDFIVGGDSIDLSGIDAITTAGGDQAFKFLGTGAFTGKAGELHYAQSGGNTIVTADINGDAVADFSLVLSGLQNLKATDFVL